MGEGAPARSLPASASILGTTSVRMSTDPSFSAPAASIQAYRQRVEAAAHELQERVSSVPSVGVVLHDGIEVPPAFEGEARWRPAAFSAQGEDTRGGWAVGTLDGIPVVVDPAAGALHDGATPRAVTLSVRALAVAGVDTLLLANTGTSVAPPNDGPALVAASDHVNFQGANPLVGPNVEDWGPRFPDMTAPYDASLREAARAVALREGLSLRDGVFLALLGPERGTPAEHRMARRLGADVVGTDAVQKVIAARHMGCRVGLFSVVTDPDDGAGAGPDRTDARRAIHSQLHTLLAAVAADVKSEQKSN